MRGLRYVNIAACEHRRSVFLHATALNLATRIEVAPATSDFSIFGIHIVMGRCDAYFARMRLELQPYQVILETVNVLRLRHGDGTAATFEYRIEFQPAWLLLPFLPRETL